jgi:hypothetical protein
VSVFDLSLIMRLSRAWSHCNRWMYGALLAGLIALLSRSQPPFSMRPNLFTPLATNACEAKDSFISTRKDRRDSSAIRSMCFVKLSSVGARAAAQMASFTCATNHTPSADDNESAEHKQQ